MSKPSPKSVLPANQQLRVSAGRQLRFRLSADGPLYFAVDRLLHAAVEFQQRDTRFWYRATRLRHTDVGRLNAADSHRDTNCSGARRLIFSQLMEHTLPGCGRIEREN
jgi:hypothetical protein